MPEPLSVRLMALAVKAAQASTVPAPNAVLDDDYGDGESLVLLRPGNPPTPVPVEQIRICDLRDILDSGGAVIGWNHEAAVPAGTIGVDPERGRVVLGAPADGPLLATFHYGSAREFGGGEYEREPQGDELANQQTVANSGPLAAGLDAIAGGGRLTDRRQPDLCRDAGLQGRRRHGTGRAGTSGRGRRAQSGAAADRGRRRRHARHRRARHAWSSMDW